MKTSIFITITALAAAHPAQEINLKATRPTIEVAQAYLTKSGFNTEDFIDAVYRAASEAGQVPLRDFERDSISSGAFCYFKGPNDSQHYAVISKAHSFTGYTHVNGSGVVQDVNSLLEDSSFVLDYCHNFEHRC